jgi:plastocyanin
MLTRQLLALTITLAACSDSGSATVDAVKQIDASQATVMAVTCPSGTLPTITATDGDDTKFMPSSVTINVNDIVKFTMPATHNVAPNTVVMTDPGLMVNFRETKCLMFTKAGTFGFKCVPHSFVGSVIVQ